MFWLFFVVSLSAALDPNPTDITKRCYKCNVYSAAGRMKCENPGVCYSNFCYSYVTSAGTTMFLSGCAEDVSDFGIRGSPTGGIYCKASNEIAICICSTESEVCNLPEEPKNNTKLLKNIRWSESEEERMDNISFKVTGFSVDYANKRLEHLKQDGIEKAPKHFNLSRITNSARRTLSSVVVFIGIFVSFA